MDAAGHDASIQQGLALTSVQLQTLLTGGYFFKPAANFSGTADITFNAQVADNASGAIKNITGLHGTVEVDAVANMATAISAAGQFSADNGEYLLTLSGNFADTSGRESHSFLVQVPTGLHLEGGYQTVTNPDATHTGTYYVIPAGNDAAAQHVDLAFTADPTWNGTSDITYCVQVTDGAATAISANATVDVPNSFDHYTVPGTGLPMDFGSADKGVHFTGSDGSDVVVGSSHADVIHGGAGDDVIAGGIGHDTIHGGTGNDNIHGGAGNDIIYGGEGHDIIRGGLGDDTMYAGNADGSPDNARDTFLWLSEDLGSPGHAAHDVIHGFQLDADSTKGDVISLGDLFGQPGSIDDLLDSASVDSVTRTVSFEANNMTFEAKFENDKELMLTLKDSGGNEIQKIDVHAATGTQFTDNHAGLDDEAAKELLKQMIKDGM